jgi:hypothetical protein
MNKDIKIALIFLILGCGLFTGTYFLSKKYISNKSETDCQTASSVKTGDTCYVWDSNTCRTGTIDKNSNCVSSGSVLPLLMLLAGIACIITFFIYFVRGLNSKKRSKKRSKKSRKK